MDKPGKYSVRQKNFAIQATGQSVSALNTTFLTKTTWETLRHGFNNQINLTQMENIKNQQAETK